MKSKKLVFKKNELYAEAVAIADRLRASGHVALFAGGCIRDTLLHRSIKDIDIATSAKPGEVEEIFVGETISVGKAFGVIVVKGGHANFEVATFRADGKYRDGRHPESVCFADAEADAQRRDFTINGLFFDYASESVFDYVDGLADIDKKTVRAIGDPQKRFAEDRLRMLRAVRFASVLGFKLDEATAKAVKEAASEIKSVSAERIGIEFTRMLVEAQKPSRMLEMLFSLGLLAEFLPELQALRGCRQPPKFHPEGDVWTHTSMMLDLLPPPRNVTLAYAALLHDIGKPATTIESCEPDGSIRLRSPNHAAVGAEMVPVIMHRLKLPTALSGDVESIVRRHMTFIELDKMRIATRRRFMGVSTFSLEVELNRLDLTCSCGDGGLIARVKELADEFANEPVLPKPLLNGRDLLAAGFQSGVKMGKLLKLAYDKQLEDGSADKETLMKWVRGIPDANTNSSK